MRILARIILPVILLYFSCKKEDPVPITNPEPEKGMLKKVWVRPLVESAPPGGLCMAGFIFEDHVYFNDEYKAELKGYPLDGKGETRSLAKGSFFISPSQRNHALVGSDLYYQSLTKKIQKLDLYSGTITELYHGSNNMGARMSFFDNEVYFEEAYIEGSRILSVKVQSQQIDTLINYKLEPGWQGSFEPPTHVTWHGRDYLAFQLREAGPQARHKQSYFLYDVDADSLVWSNIQTDTLVGGVGEPAFDDDHIYWMGGTSVFALSLEDGEIVWRHDNPDGKGHFHGFIFKHQNKVVVKSDGMLTTALDPKTGKVIWMNKESGSTPSDTYEVMDNSLCFYSRGKGYFSAVDLQYGGSLIYEMSPVKNYDNSVTMGTSIIIDEKTRRLYYANHSDVVCLEIAPYKRW